MKLVQTTKKAKKPASKAKSCGANSFAQGTLVLMADGTTTPIEDVSIGDFVYATDPVTGETHAEPVSGLITGAGTKELVRIGTDPDGDGSLDWVTATAGHPFWVARTGWTDAGDLAVGDLLIGDNGELVDVYHLDTTTRVAVVHNLTVNVVHTYYVLAGDTTLLVHNAGKCKIEKAANYDSNSRTFKTKRAAIGAAKQDEKRFGGVYRGQHRSDPRHVHVDYKNGRGQLKFTMHLSLEVGEARE